jgi:branched-chain amino acid aminotransferase
VPYTREQIAAACVETMRANKMAEAYLRPLVFLGDGELGLGSLGNPVRVAIAVYEWGAYLGEEGLRRGIRAKVSSYTRGALNSTMSKGKICGQYVNSVLAKREAIKSGYSEAILLDNNGLVAEASGENIFVVRRGKLKTPPLSAAILEGITRDTVITLARELGLVVEETTFARDEMYRRRGLLHRHGGGADAGARDRRSPDRRRRVRAGDAQAAGRVLRSGQGAPGAGEAVASRVADVRLTVALV